MQVTDCPICGYHLFDPAIFIFKSDTYQVTCRRCGSYIITQESMTYVDVKEKIRENQWKLSGLIRNANELEKSPLPIVTTKIDDLISESSILPKQNDINTKSKVLIEAIRKRTQYLGARVELDLSLDYPLCFATNSVEFEKIIDSLVKKQLLHQSYMTLDGHTEVELSEEAFSQADANIGVNKIIYEGDDPMVNLDVLHPEIRNKCESLFITGHFSDAAEKGFKVVKDKLRKLTGFEGGSDAIGKGGLHILGAAAANVDGDFNSAAKYLLMAIDMFRNEKTHTAEGEIKDAVRGYHYLVISSLAMFLIDNSEVIKRSNTGN